MQEHQYHHYILVDAAVLWPTYCLFWMLHIIFNLYVSIIHIPRKMKSNDAKVWAAHNDAKLSFIYRHSWAVTGNLQDKRRTVS